MSQEGGQAGKRGEGRQWEVATRRPGGYGCGGVVGSGSHLAGVGRAARRRAGPGRAGLSFVSSAFGFCFASASFGRAGAGAPPPESLLAVSQLSSEGEASAADWPASRTAGPLTPLGLRVRRVLRTGGRRAAYSQKCRRP